MGVSENSVPLNPMVLLIIIPIKWLFHWEYTQHFQTNHPSSSIDIPQPFLSGNPLRRSIRLRDFPQVAESQSPFDGLT